MSKTELQKRLGTAIVALALAVSPHALAGLVEVNFTADVNGIVASGQYILDTSAPLDIGVGGQTNIVVDGFLDVGGAVETIVPDSFFTFAAAGQSDTFGLLGLSGGFSSAGGFFALQLSSTLFFDTANALDVLTADLSLDDLIGFTGPDLRSSYLFYAPVGTAGDAFELSSLSIVTSTAVAEPATLWLVMSAFLLIAGLRRAATVTIRSR